MTLNDTLDGARALLQGGDTSPARGLGNGVIQSAFNNAYTEMWQTMEQVQTPRVRREFYYLVPAYTSYVDPVTAGVLDMGEPELMYERGNLTSVQIAATSGSTPIEVDTVTPHNLTSNADVTIGGVTLTSKPDGRWFVTVLDGSTLTLNGSVSDGTEGVGGWLTTSPEMFLNNPVAWRNELTDEQLSPRLRWCMWEDGVFKFRGATSPAQIRVTYFANATPPTNPLALIGVPEGATFLQTRTASIMARSRGLYQMADALKLDALGPGGQADGRGGQLRTFLNIQVNGLQRTQFRKQPYVSGAWGLYNQFWGSTAFGGGFV